MKKTVTITVDETVLKRLQEYIDLRNHDGVVIPLTISSTAALCTAIGSELVLGKLNEARINAISEDAEKMRRRAENFGTSKKKNER